MEEDSNTNVMLKSKWFTLKSYFQQYIFKTTK